MTTAAELSVLRDLQKLREERAKIDHMRALAAKDKASAARTVANEHLSASDEALTRYAEQRDIELSQFQILAQRVSDLATALRANEAEHAQAIEAEREARSSRRLHEQQSENIGDHHREAIRHERRKREDRRDRDFLSAWIRPSGEKP